MQIFFQILGKKNRDRARGPSGAHPRGPAGARRAGGERRPSRAPPAAGAELGMGAVDDGAGALYQRHSRRGAAAPPPVRLRALDRQPVGRGRAEAAGGP